jgi:hypothetical protein
MNKATSFHFSQLSAVMEASNAPIRLRTRRRSSAPDLSRGLGLWSTSWAPGNDAPTNNPWNTVNTPTNQDFDAKTPQDLPSGSASPSQRRRSSAPSPNAVLALRKRTLSREDVLEDATNALEDDGGLMEAEDDVVEDMNFATTSKGSQMRIRRTSSNPDLDMDKLINEDYFMEDFRLPRRGSRRHSSRSSRSKSVELGASL